MHTEMWEHPAVVDNVATLRRRGVTVVGPDPGRLAGGDVGAGRLAEPAAIVAAVATAVGGRRGGDARGQDGPGAGGRDLEGVRVLVTAGGTREPIDAVRVIANRSSGRQGHAVAAVAAARGADVVLVTASELEPPGGVEVIRVETAAQLAAAVLERSKEADVVVMAAAVADFRPAHPFPGKLSKRVGTPEVVLEPTEDVLAALGRRRRTGQILVGFAAESGPGARERARAKLEEKGADLFVVNDVSQHGVGFGHETNAVTILDRRGNSTDVPLAPKPTIAAVVLDAVASWRRRQGQAGSTEPSGTPRRGAVQ